MSADTCWLIACAISAAGLAPVTTKSTSRLRIWNTSPIATIENGGLGAVSIRVVSRYTHGYYWRFSINLLASGFR